MKWNNDTIRDLERQSIRKWVEHAAEGGCFDGKRVLDVGCGREPYRAIVEEHGGRYYGYDHPEFPGSVVTEEVGEQPWSKRWGAILCTQVLQYQTVPQAFVSVLYHHLRDDSALVITWPTCWDEVEPSDLFRFTQQGGLMLLGNAGFKNAEAFRRAEIKVGGFTFPLGYGAVAWK